MSKSRRMKRKQENLEKMVERNEKKWAIFSKKVSILFSKEIQEFENHEFDAVIYFHSERRYFYNIFLSFNTSGVSGEHSYFDIHPSGEYRGTSLAVGRLIPYREVDKKKLIQRIKEEFDRERYWLERD